MLDAVEYARARPLNYTPTALSYSATDTVSCRRPPLLVAAIVAFATLVGAASWLAFAWPDLVRVEEKNGYCLCAYAPKLARIAKSLNAIPNSCPGIFYRFLPEAGSRNPANEPIPPPPSTLEIGQCQNLEMQARHHRSSGKGMLAGLGVFSLLMLLTRRYRRERSPF